MGELRKATDVDGVLARMDTSRCFKQPEKEEASRIHAKREKKLQGKTVERNYAVRAVLLITGAVGGGEMEKKGGCGQSIFIGRGKWREEKSRARSASADVVGNPRQKDGRNGWRKFLRCFSREGKRRLRRKSCQAIRSKVKAWKIVQKKKKGNKDLDCDVADAG